MHGSPQRVGKRHALRELLTRHSSIPTDLWALYQFDAWEALGSDSRRVALLFGLVERLQYEPMSVYRAETAGNMEFMGWTRQATVLSAIYNVLAARAKGKSLKKNEMYPVPEVQKKRREPAPRSVKELDWSKMIGDLRG